MPLTCIRKRWTDGVRCAGTWACTCGRSNDRLGLPRAKRIHTFLRWQQHSQSRIAASGLGQNAKSPCVSGMPALEPVADLMKVVMWHGSSFLTGASGSCDTKPPKASGDHQADDA